MWFTEFSRRTGRGGQANHVGDQSNECGCHARWPLTRRTGGCDLLSIAFHRHPTPGSRRNPIASHSGYIGYMVGPERFCCGCRILAERTRDLCCTAFGFTPAAMLGGGPGPGFARSRPPRRRRESSQGGRWTPSSPSEHWTTCCADGFTELYLTPLLALGYAAYRCVDDLRSSVSYS